MDGIINRISILHKFLVMLVLQPVERIVVFTAYDARDLSFTREDYREKCSLTRMSGHDDIGFLLWK